MNQSEAAQDMCQLVTLTLTDPTTPAADLLATRATVAEITEGCRRACAVAMRDLTIVRPDRGELFDQIHQTINFLRAEDAGGFDAATYDDADRMVGSVVRALDSGSAIWAPEDMEPTAVARALFVLLEALVREYGAALLMSPLSAAARLSEAA